MFISVLKGFLTMDFKQIDRILMRNTIVRYRYDILNQTNKREEFKKFIQDEMYNPQFTYNHFDARPYIDELSSLEIPIDTNLGKLFEEMRVTLLIEAKALHNIGTPKYNTTGLHTKVPQKVLDKAHQILAEPGVDDEKEIKDIPARKLASIIREHLDNYGLHEWIVDLNPYAVARASVTAAQKKVTLKAKELFSQEDVTKLLVHEIDTHVLRAVNGEAQPYKIFSIGVSHYLATEEGMAGFNERKKGVVRNSILRHYALSAIITHLCFYDSFRDVYNQVRQYFYDDWSCFKAIARAKRGIGDSALPGGYLKDHCYLEGMMIIDEFVENRGDLKKLYVGKIGLQHLHLVEQGILLPAKILPDFLK